MVPWSSSIGRAAVVTLALCAACSSASGGSGAGPSDGGGSHADAGSGSGPGSDSGQATEDAGNGGGNGPGDGGGSCGQTCPGMAPAGSLCVVSADAQLVDATGAPAPGEVLLLCGTNLCSLPVKTDAQGKAHFDLCLNMSSPALKFLGDASYVSFGVGMTQSVQTFPPITLVPLPAQGQAFPSGAGSVTSSGVTLQVSAPPAFDITQPADANSHEFRAAQVDVAHAPPNLPASYGAKALWGLAPPNATLSPAASLTVPNPDPSGWPAGTVVDFFMNGLDENSNAPVPYGGWGRVGSGTVSQDAKTITTDTGTGNGLPLVGLVGVGPHA